MKVLHTVDSLHARHGGPSRSVTALCDALSALNIDVQVAAGGEGEKDNAVMPKEPSVEVTLHENSITAMYRVRRRLVREMPHNDAIVHDHGLWLPSNYVTARTAARNAIPYVVSVRGMLEPWSLQQQRFRKRLAWQVYQRRILANAAVLHATAESEAEAIRSLGLKTPIAVIPNGVSVPGEEVYPKGTRGTRRALFLSRVHPKKGLVHLLGAWAKLRPEGWELIIAGPDEDGHRAELEALTNRFGLNDAVSFLGAFADSEKWDLYASADLFVLPTHSENFGIVVAEAMAMGLPVITTKGAPWALLEEIDAGWWTDVAPESIASALEEATSMEKARLVEMGKRGGEYVRENLSWSVIGDLMSGVYRWVLRKGEVPETVILP